MAINSRNLRRGIIGELPGNRRRRFEDKTMPPLPVEKQNGFYVFCHPNGRFSNAVTVNGRRHYASDYKQFAGVNVPDDIKPIEPTDSEYLRLMGW